MREESDFGMKQFPIFFCAFLFLVSCSSETPEKCIAANEIIFNQDEVTQTEDGTMTKHVMTSASQFSPCKEVWINSHKFDLSVQGIDTIYLATSDRLFQTPEKFLIGTTFAEIPEKLRKTLHKEAGWGYYIKLPSGWNLGFCEGTSCTDSEPINSSKVKWIFKRK